MELSQIPKSVQQTLFKRIDALNRESNYDPLNTLSNIPDAAVSEMLTKSVWVTVTSSVLDYTDEGKLANKELLQLSSAYKDKQPINKPLTSTDNLFTNDTTALFRGHTGITSVTTDFKNASMQYVTINWTLNDPEKILNSKGETNFEKYRNAFLKHGVYVQVEFGWSTPEIQTGLTSIKAEDMRSLFTQQKKQMIERGGNYYIATGRIVDFSFTVGPNGEYKCTTKLVSMANDIFSGQIENDSDKRPIKLKFDENIQDVDESYRNASVYFESYMKSLDDQIKLEYDKFGNTQDALDNGIYHDGTRGYCNWGWFEDHVINTFFAFEGVMVENTDEEGNPQNLMTVVRSLVAKFKEIKDGDSFRYEEEPGLKSNTCRNSIDLKTLDLDVVLPGKIDNLSDIITITQEDNGPFPTEIKDKYKKIFNTYSMLNNMPKFTNPDNIDEGFIRNIVFSSTFLKSTFGSGVSNVKDALTNHWSSVSAKYSSFWDFSIRSNVHRPHILETVESKVPGGVKMQDANTFLQEGNQIKSTRDNPEGTFVFSLYSKDSLMKDFSLDVKMTSAMATMAALHTNKNVDKEGDYESPNPERDSMVALGYLNQTKADELSEKENKKDQTLDPMKMPFQKGNKIFSKLVDNLPGNLKSEKFDSKAKELMVSPDSSEEGIEDYVREMDTIDTTEQSISDLDDGSVNYKYPTEEEDVLMYDSDGNMLDVFRRVLLNRLTLIDSKGKSSYDPIVPISVTFTIPGIGGIMPFNIFQVDYLPEVYRKYVVFQVRNVSHNCSPQGWSTTITSIMRVDMNTLLADTRVDTQKSEESEQLEDFKSLDYVLASLKLQNLKKRKDSDLKEDDKEESSWWPGRNKPKE